MKAKTGVAFEGWVPLRRTKRKATPVTLPILDPVQKLLSYVDSKMEDDSDVMKVCEIPKDKIEKYTFLRVRTIYFDFEQLATREMDRIQVEQGLKIQKKRVRGVSNTFEITRISSLVLLTQYRKRKSLEIPNSRMRTRLNSTLECRLDCDVNLNTQRSNTGTDYGAETC